MTYDTNPPAELPDLSVCNTVGRMVEISRNRNCMQNPAIKSIISSKGLVNNATRIMSHLHACKS